MTAGMFFCLMCLDTLLMMSEGEDAALSVSVGLLMMRVDSAGRCGLSCATVMAEYVGFLVGVFVAGCFC